MDAQSSHVPVGARPVRCDGYVFETVAEELVLFAPGRAAVLYCNSSAALVWGLCDGSRTVEGIVAMLTDAYPDADPGLAADVHTAVEQLIAHRALALVPDPAAP